MKKIIVAIIAIFVLSVIGGTLLTSTNADSFSPNSLSLSRKTLIYEDNNAEFEIGGKETEVRQSPVAQDLVASIVLEELDEFKQTYYDSYDSSSDSPNLDNAKVTVTIDELNIDRSFKASGINEGKIILEPQNIPKELFGKELYARVVVECHEKGTDFRKVKHVPVRFEFN